MLKDKMFIYSKPQKTKKTKLGVIFYMRGRKFKEKPGRELHVAFDGRLPLIKGFQARYIYWVKFFKKNNFAGNHYHLHKKELFMPLVGNFLVKLRDEKTKKTEEIRIKEQDKIILYVKSYIAHKVISKSNKSILLVVATHPDSFVEEIKTNPL